MRDDTILIHEVIKKVPNKYYAVVLSSKRARDLNMGLAPLIRTDSVKPTTISLEEIAAGSYTLEMAMKGLKAVRGVVEVVSKRLPPVPEADDEEIEEPELIAGEESEEEEDYDG